MHSLQHPAGYNRIARKLLHIAGGVFALLVGVLPWWVFLLLALAGLALAYWLRPDHGMLRAITKPVDRQRGMISGVRGYFWTATLLALLWPLLGALGLAQPQRFIAFGWLALTLGDGLAGILGPAPGSLNTVPWNREKTWWGMWGCFLGALLGFSYAFGPLRIDGVQGGLGLPVLITAGVLCSAVVAVAESINAPVDDNYVVGIGAPLIALLALGMAGVL
jgi:dolichol kinase